MSKEMTIIVLGLVVMASRTLLGLPGAWETALLVLSGGAIAIIGFLLRGEALSGGTKPHARNSFVESVLPTHQEPMHTHDEHKEGIGALN